MLISCNALKHLSNYLLKFLASNNLRILRSISDLSLYYSKYLSFSWKYFFLFFKFLSFFIIITFLYFTILYWFCHTSTWIHHGCTRVPNPEPTSHLRNESWKYFYKSLHPTLHYHCWMDGYLNFNYSSKCIISTYISHLSP